MYSAKIILDSISHKTNVRLTTLEVVMPRIILAEFNTHRAFSRNSASSRAIPVSIILKRVQDNPYIPKWKANQKGMQPGDYLEDSLYQEATDVWLEARDEMIKYASKLMDIGVHKQWANRLLEPFMWHTALVSATEWDNFINLRAHADAQDDIRIPAEMIKNLISTEINKSTPKVINEGEWHLPLIQPDERSLDLITKIKVSVGRCARVSYLTHDGKRDIQADVDLFTRLVTHGHLSPCEHVATPIPVRAFEGWPGDQFIGNFRGWKQIRKFIPNEHDILGSNNVIDVDKALLPIIQL